MPKQQKHKLTPRQQRMWFEYEQRQKQGSKFGLKSMELAEPTIDSIESLYKALGGHEKIRNQAALMLNMKSWLTEVSDFDPVTGHALDAGIVNFLDAVAQGIKKFADDREINDRIYRIVSHVKGALHAIMGNMRDKILRVHTMMPIHAAREVDSISVQWLSHKPGRTLREKLSGKPYIKAVQRKSSVDTSENRLLKAFILRLEQVLIERQTALNSETEKTCDELLIFMQRWLRNEEFSEVGNWGSLPPNNTLLQDKRYRKIWDGWLWSQSIDEDISADYKRLRQDVLVVIYWKLLSLLNKTGQFRTVQQPLNIDYDNFIITSTLPIKGYLLPKVDSLLISKVKSIHYGKKFGYLFTDTDDLFFDKNNLSKGLELSSLTVGDAVSFEIGQNGQSECANNINLIRCPETINFNLLCDQFIIDFGKNKIIIQSKPDGITIVQKPNGYKKRFELKLSTCIDVPNTILYLIFKESSISFPKAGDKNQKDLIQTDMSVVDLCSIRPRFTNNTGSQSTLPFRLLQQCWPVDANGGVIIDCGAANAVTLRSDIETVSMRSLFSSNATLSDASKSSASMFFMKKLKDYISTNTLSYLVPDWGNDFDLESIRKSINFYFSESIPLPKSIAAIFAWQESKRFEQNKIRNNDFVLVVDAFDGGISITPVQAIYQKDLIDILPETIGIYWERHPTLLINNKDIHLNLVRNLSHDGCLNSETLIQLFGFDGLVNDAGELSFVDNEDWYHLPTCIGEILNHDLDENVLSLKILTDSLHSLNNGVGSASVFILPLEDTIKKPKLPSQYHWIGSDWSPIKGCQTLTEWQKMADDIPLWRDHLPELLIRVVRNGYYENFYLVQDATVIPQRGRKVSIPVKESFTLPAGQPHYSFPLQQGEGNQELQFVAYLKSPSFPLKEDTACKLHMTYTYGADDPYELKFMPIDVDTADFKSIRAEWRSIAESTAIDLSNLPVPSFPTRQTWADFQKFPKENGTDFSNLLEWVMRELNKVQNIASYGRIKAPIGQWKVDKNGKQFCFVDNIFLHESAFELKNSSALPQPEEIVSFYKIERQADRFTGQDISVGNFEPIRCFLKKSLRFPVLTIWNNGHSLSESDAPDYFRNSIFEGTNAALTIINSENIPDSLKEELFFFLSCLHKDAPAEVSNRLLGISRDKKLLRRYYRNIAFSIGNAELSWQQELLDKVVSLATNDELQDQIAAAQKYSAEDALTGFIKKWGLIDKNGRKYGFIYFRGNDHFCYESSLVEISQAEYLSSEDSVYFSLQENRVSNVLMNPSLEVYDILAIAFWRSQDLIYKLTEPNLEALSNNLIGCLKFDVQKVINGGRHYQVATLCKHLELLLALLMTREFKNEKIKNLLSPNRDITKRYTLLIDAVSKVVMDNNIELRSRISLQIKKPDMFHNTPDLLYALRMYLTGDSGANTIIITGISDDD